ncbi:MAG: MBL fold metallo-hydrolase [Candidatus Aminicenantes bacterium]|nr:MBL fold metallo-hydrolase [Candidatus Aminicenantes bacterium]
MISNNSDKQQQQILPCIQEIDGIDQLIVVSYVFPPEMAHRTNCFLIGDKGDKKLIVDPSPFSDEEYKRLVNTLKNSFEYTYTDIFITHHHVDHVNEVQKLAREFAIPIIISEDSYGRLLKKNGPDFFANINIKFAREGDVLTHWNGQDVKVFEIPGHDEGQLALAPESMTWFLVGDLIQGEGLEPGSRASTVVIATKEGDMKKYFRTLERIIRLNPKYLLPSHGMVLKSVAPLEKTLIHRIEREQQVLKLYKQGKTPEQMTKTLYKRVNKALWPLALENIKTHLKKLEQEGLLINKQ